MKGKSISRVLAAVGGFALLASSFVAAADYTHEVKAQKMTFAWKVNGDKLEIKLAAETTGWLAIGFNPTDGMKGANYILGYVKDGKVTLADDFGDTPVGHKADEKLGGTEDVTLIGGTEQGGTTTIEFAIPMNSADANDGKIDVNAETVVLLAYGPADRDSFKTKHKFRTGLKVNLGTGASSEAGI
jgi:DOMON domain